MDRQKSGQTDKNAKFRLMTAMFIFGTIGIFVRNIPLPSSVIALARGVSNNFYKNKKDKNFVYGDKE